MQLLSCVLKNNKKNFIFECLKCERRTSFIADYFISKFLTVFEYQNYNHEKVILLLRKGVICYEFIYLVI